MQSCILLVGILLSAQISNADEGRYPAYPADEVAASDQTTEAADSPPATHQPPATAPDHSAEPAGLTKVVPPAELFAGLTKTAGAEQLIGQPLPLVAAVQTAQSRAEQTQRVQTYWELSQAVAEFRLASLETLELPALVQGIGQPSQAWTIASQAAEARRQTALSAVKAIQYRLQQEMGEDRGDGKLALPSDPPHCGAYETKYQQIFRGRTSSEAQQLSKLLPLVHEQLAQRALDSTAALEWLSTVSKQRSPQSDGMQLLKAYEQLALERRAFVATAYQYNSYIARYTALAVPQGVGAGRLTAMLIQVPESTLQEWRRSNIQRATAEEDIPQGSENRNRDRTFAEPDRSETRRAPTKEQDVEHSIVVPPKGFRR